MKIFLILAIILCFAFMISPMPSWAQYEANPGASDNEGSSTVTVGPVIGFPTSTFSDVAHVGIGLTGTYDYGITNHIAAEAVLGYITFGGKTSGITYSAIPLLAGARYFIGRPDSRFYLGGLFGLHFFSTKTKFTNPVTGLQENNSTGNTEFTVTPMAGYEYGINDHIALDLSGRYQYVSGNFTYFGLRAAVNFRLK